MIVLFVIVTQDIEYMSVEYTENWAYSESLSRSTHDLVAMDGWLYAVGGNDGSSSLNSIEKYNPRSNKWVAASCMFTRRSSVGVAVLELLNFPPPSSPTLSVSSTSLWHGVTAWLTSASAATAQTGSGKRRNCSVWELEVEKDWSRQVKVWRGTRQEVWVR